jgi:DNA-binding beta-propeller fold protein YncE
LWAPAGLAVDPVRDELLVVNQGNNSVTVYPRLASGDTAPLRTLQGFSTGLWAPAGLVVDPVRDELLVVNQGNNSITVYPRRASGDTAPLRTLQGFSTGLSGPRLIAITTSAPIAFAPTVAVLDSATETVTSTPAWVTCPGTCTTGFPRGKPVTLTSTPAGDWGGVCAPARATATRTRY